MYRLHRRKWPVCLDIRVRCPTTAKCGAQPMPMMRKLTSVPFPTLALRRIAKDLSDDNQ